MAKILQVIPKQKFEFLAPRIAEILTDEILNQYLLTYNSDYLVNVFLERSKNLDAELCPGIIVSLARGGFGNEDAISSDGTYNINIDVYTKAKTTKPLRGDSLSSLKLQRLLGICRAIIMNPLYDTLGFQAPFICNRTVSEMPIAVPDSDDVDNVSMGRLVVNVRCDEGVWVATPPLIEGYDTQVKLGETEQGYIFSGDNIPSPPIDAIIITAQSTLVTS